MKKTFVTLMPDKAGAFLAASKIMAQNNVNITRVSYNKTVDAHALFLDVAGKTEDVLRAGEELKNLGYLSQGNENAKTILLEFVLPDVAGSVTPVLEIINEYNFNISYINSQQNGSEYQYFKMGLFIEKTDDIQSFLQRVSLLCRVNVIDYDKTEKNLDNTVFYLTFADGIVKKLDLSGDAATELITDSNLIMQRLDERNESPYKTFEYISKFADLIARYKFGAFKFRLTEYTLPSGKVLRSLEPPCGSNIYTFENNGELFFIDSGFACYGFKTAEILRSVYPEFDNRKKTLILTHTDMDHCGFNSIFDKILVVKTGYENFVCEVNGEPNFREQNSSHAPYCRMTAVLTDYKTPILKKISVIGGDCKADSPLSFICEQNIGGFDFEVYQGNGGHVAGETVFIDRKNKVAFTGDVLVNTAGYTAEQKEFNLIAPFLMTSVNTDSVKAKLTREELLKIIDKDYLICGGHGAPYKTTD